MSKITTIMNKSLGFLNLLGINLVMTRDALSNFGQYKLDRSRFRELGGHIMESMPILNEFSTAGGTSSGHYFHQDLLVASQIFKNNPRRHVDVGSRVDGFCAHVASFREIEVIDINPTRVSNHSNLKFEVLDLMTSSLGKTTDSLSCLHAIEHFGLGRYGDPIDPTGHIKGFQNLIRMLEKGGTLYISFPISTRPRVVFNAHRIFHPKDIFEWNGCDNLNLIGFDYVDDIGDLHRNANVNEIKSDLSYGCGIYTFSKIL
jgi:hypothetical protein